MPKYRLKNGVHSISRWEGEEGDENRRQVVDQYNPGDVFESNDPNLATKEPYRYELVDASEPAGASEPEPVVEERDNDSDNDET